MRTFDPYTLYEQSVQDPESEIRFLNKKFQKFRGKRPLSLREDFCATGYLSAEWIQQGKRHTAIGIDIDPHVIEQGERRHRSRLRPQQQRRLRYLQRNVLDCAGIQADVIVAFNFSYWVFKERNHLRRYFRSVRKSMKRESLFFIDVMGGEELGALKIERQRFRGFTYYWECESYNPITNHALYAIHYKLHHERRKRKRVFTYDWRCWSIPEIRELLREAGFSQSVVFWEGDDGRGGGNGIFKPTEKAENCLSWIAYLAAFP